MVAASFLDLPPNDDPWAGVLVCSYYHTLDCAFNTDLLYTSSLRSIIPHEAVSGFTPRSGCRSVGAQCIDSNHRPETGGNVDEQDPQGLDGTCMRPPPVPDRVMHNDR